MVVTQADQRPTEAVGFAFSLEVFEFGRVIHDDFGGPEGLAYFSNGLGQQIDDTWCLSLAQTLIQVAQQDPVFNRVFTTSTGKEKEDVCWRLYHDNVRIPLLKHIIEQTGGVQGVSMTYQHAQQLASLALSGQQSLLTQVKELQQAGAIQHYLIVTNINVFAAAKPAPSAPAKPASAGFFDCSGQPESPYERERDALFGPSPYERKNTTDLCSPRSAKREEHRSVLPGHREHRSVLPMALGKMLGAFRSWTAFAKA
jgi:hypothetical protein